MTAERLADGFIPLFRYVLKFRQGPGFPSYDRVREDIVSLLRQSESRSGSTEDYIEARYAICAWIDESILDSGWDQRSRWQRELLQRVHYNSSNAGEAFFTRMAAVDKTRRQVQEVFFLCLALGFKGRYSGDTDALDRMKTKLLSSIFESGAEPPSLDKMGLFADPQPVAQQKTRAGRWTDHPLFPKAVIAGVPVLVVLALWIIYRTALSGVADNIVKAGWVK